MHKKLMLLAILGMMLLPILAMAEDKGTVDQLGDIFSGRGTYYAAPELLKEITFEKPIFGLDKIQAGIGMDIELGEPAGEVRDIVGKIPVRFIF